MKQWITLVAVTAIFSACTKQDLQQEKLQQQKAVETTAMRSSQDGAYVSDWEQYAAWYKTDEGNTSKFTVVRKADEVNSGVINGGLVLSYAKITTNDPLYASFNDPKMLPFYFLPESERPNPQTYYFSSTSADGSITITYRSPFTKQDRPSMGGGASLQAMQFQHVVLSKAFLDAHGLSAETVKNYYTYNQVMNLVNP